MKKTKEKEGEEEEEDKDEENKPRKRSNEKGRIEVLVSLIFQLQTKIRSLERFLASEKTKSRPSS